MATPVKKPKKPSTAKTSTAKTPEASVLKGPVMVEGVKHLDPMDLMRFELAQHKVKSATQEVQLKQAEMEQLKNNFERGVGLLRQQQAELAIHQRQAQQELFRLQEEVERVYDVKVSEITYDDVSGRIRNLQDPDI